MSQLVFTSEDTFISGGNDGVIAIWKLSQTTATVTMKPEVSASDASAKKGRRQKSGKGKIAASKAQPETKVTVQTVIEPLTQIQHEEAINWISISRGEEADEVRAGAKESLQENTLRDTSSCNAEGDAQEINSSSTKREVKKLERMVVAVADSTSDITLYEINA